MKRRGLAALLGALALTLSAMTAVLATAPTGHKVTLCHATSSEKNPYVQIRVDISSAGYGDKKGGHDSHGRDGVWYPGAKADGFDWGDIIPAYDYTPPGGQPFHYPGLNLTDEGRAILENGCKIPQEQAHDPAIDIVKTASPTTLPAGGGSVTYTYKVRATGNVPLTDISVTDDKCSPISYQSGDTNRDDILDLGETWTYTCTKTITKTTTNIGVATGYDHGTKVTDHDRATVTVAQPVDAPAIHIEKTVLPLTLPAGGGDVTYTYVVRNTGNVALTNVKVRDDNGTPGNTADDFDVDCPKTTLAVNAAMTCTADVEGTTATTTNIATASGKAHETTVTDTDDATVTVGFGGGVQGETDVPTAPQTDTIGSTGDAGSSLPILLIVLGIVSLGAVFLTPARGRR